jgi:hypothetical protein
MAVDFHSHLVMLEVLEDGIHLGDPADDDLCYLHDSAEAIQLTLCAPALLSHRETDESVSEPQFINLSYVQAQHDYLAGNYPVVREDAAQVRHCCY